MFCFPNRGPRELYPLSFHELCVHMRLNKTKFERNSSLEYYHMTCIGKTKHTGLRGLLVILMHVSLCQFLQIKFFKNGVCQVSAIQLGFKKGYPEFTIH